MAMALQTPESFLNELDRMKTTFHFVKAQDSVDMDVNTNQEMTRVKEHFGKLKMTYLQLETKQLMLESIATDGVLNTVNQTEIKALEQTVARGKKALRSVKMNIKEVRGEVQELLLTLADKLQRFDMEKQKFDEVYDKENSVKNRLDVKAVQAENESSLCFGKAAAAHMELDSESKCKTVLKGQMECLKQLTAEIEDMQAKMNVLEAKGSSLDKALTSIVAVVESLGASDSANPAAANNAKLHAYYGPANKLLEAVGGVKLTSASTNEDSTIASTVVAGKPSTIALRCAEVDVLLSLRYDNNHNNTLQQQQQLTGVSVTVSNNCHDQEQIASVCADIIKYAVAKNDLKFLVRETQARLHCLVTRASHVRSIMGQYPFSINLASNAFISMQTIELVVTMPAGVKVFFSVGPNYNSLAVPVALTGLTPADSSSSSISVAYLNEIIECVNQRQMSSLPEVLAFLKETVHR